MEDGQAVVDMWNEESAALVGVPVASVDWVTAPWGTPEADLEHDFAVIVAEDGEIVGYLSLVSDPPHTTVFSVGGVALSHHGRGLGAAIIEDVERRARRFTAMAAAGERVVLHVGALSDEPRVSSLLSAHGFTEARRFWSMHIRFDGAMPAADPDPIPGVEIRPLRRGDRRLRVSCRGLPRSLGQPARGEGPVAAPVRRGRGFRPRPLAAGVAATPTGGRARE